MKTLIGRGRHDFPSSYDEARAHMERTARYICTDRPEEVTALINKCWLIDQSYSCKISPATLATLCAHMVLVAGTMFSDEIAALTRVYEDLRSRNGGPLKANGALGLKDQTVLPNSNLLQRLVMVRLCGADWFPRECPFLLSKCDEIIDSICAMDSSQAKSLTDACLLRISAPQGH